MSMFSELMGKIFHHSAPAPTSSQPAGGDPGVGAIADGGASAPLGAPTADPASAPAAAPAPGTAAPAPAPAVNPSQSVDVAAVLGELSSKSSEKLDWKHSIVDMLKLLDMDSSLSARRHLAVELGYTGDENDSAAMNTWLHTAVMHKLAANGGKVPAELLK